MNPPLTRFTVPEQEEQPAEDLIEWENEKADRERDNELREWPTETN